MFAEWTLTKILNRVEISPVRKNYNFNKQERINAKPVLQSGNENLEEYACKLQLHVQFCNPKTIISLLEERAKSREPIDWIYNKEYKGLFVIESIEKTVVKQIKNTILYAEINFNMVEFPRDEEFQQEKLGEPDLSNIEQYSSSSNKIKDFAKKVKDSIVENLKETITTGNISDNLSDAAKEIYTSVASGVLNDIAGENITEIYNSVNDYADIIEQNSSLSFSDIQELISAVTSIPDLMINSALRGNIND